MKTIGALFIIFIVFFMNLRTANAVVDIVIDNLDPGFTVELGEWGNCEGNSCGGQCYGTDFRYASPKEQGDSTVYYRARFIPTIPITGEYDVYIWWPQGTDRATDAPVTVNHAHGSTLLSIDLTNNGNQWYKLGAFRFNAGNLGSIVVEDSHIGYTNADAVRFVTAKDTCSEATFDLTTGILHIPCLSIKVGDTQLLYEVELEPPYNIKSAVQK